MKRVSLILLIVMVFAACSVMNKTYVTPEGPIMMTVEDYPIIIDSAATVASGSRVYKRVSIPIIKKIEYYPSPEKFQFKINGTCIYSFTHPGSDSGPIDYQYKGNYSIKDDKIEITFTQKRSIGRMVKSAGKTFSDMDWREMNSYQMNFLLESNRDAISLLGINDEKGSEYIKK